VKRVLCAVDLSDVSAELLPYAHAIVHWYGGCLTVLHVVPTSAALEMRPVEWILPEHIVRAAACPVLTNQSPHEALSHAQHP
jgi:Universal stress protein family